MAFTARVRRLGEDELDAYDLVPRWVARRAVLVRVGWLPPGAAGLTTGRVVLLRHDEPDDGSSALIAHELVHVRQFVEMGRLFFLGRYVLDYLRNLVRLRRHHQAYLAISQEREAYDLAARWLRTRT